MLKPKLRTVKIRLPRKDVDELKRMNVDKSALFGMLLREYLLAAKSVVKEEGARELKTK